MTTIAKKINHFAGLGSQSLLRASVTARPFLVMAGLVMTGGMMPTTAVAQGANVSSGLEEIIVTARKREENIQETPISITAASGEALAARNITNSQGIAEIAPNVIGSFGFSVTGNSSAGSYFIRGIGQIDHLLNTDPGVGLYLDGVYIARSTGSIMELIDLERVEVLRGPQGTLFGRNTIGGAINVISAPPTQEFSLDGKITYGAFSRSEASLKVNGPLADTVSAKASVFYRDIDGYVDRISDGSRLGDDETSGVRIAARWQPSDVFLADISLDYTKSEGTSPPQNVVRIIETANFPSFNNGFLVGPPCVPPPGSLTNPACFNAQYEANDLFKEQGTFQSGQETEVWGLNVTLEYDLTDNLTIKSISGYRETDAFGNRDGDHTPILIQNTSGTWRHEQFSQELQLLGNLFEGRVEWIFGAYYFQEEGENISFVDFPVVSIQSGGSVDNDNLALFGQATVDITERLSVTGGLRWTDETKTFLPDQFVISDPTMTFPPGSIPGFRLVPFVESETDITEVTPMINVAYQWTDGLMTYFNYSEGFKSGGFTQRIFPPLPAPPVFDPEFVTSYEAGFKWQSESGRMRLNGAAFTTDYEDLQVQVLDGVQPLTANAGAAKVKGFELELNLAPMDGLQISAGVGFTDAEYRSLDATVLATGVTLDSEFAQIPEWTGNLGVAYEVQLGNGLGMVTPRVDLVYRSGAYQNAANTASLYQPTLRLWNAAIAYRSESERWGVSVFGRNLTDEDYFAGGFADLIDQGYAEVSVGRPREWGLSLEVSF